MLMTSYCENSGEHNSSRQEETLSFGEHNDGQYGEVTLTIEPNRELRGRILQYGEGLEIMKPEALRKQIRGSLSILLGQYEI